MEISSFNTKGINVCLCSSKKFNTTSICLVYRTPLRRETVSSYALIPRVLSRASNTHTSLRAMNAYLEETGGAELISEPVKKGEEQIISFYITAPKNYTGRLFEFLSSTVYDPLIIDGGFMPSFVHNACNVAAREIASKINNKRSYAAEKMLEIMCRSEHFGICGDGYIEDFGDISGKGLYGSYRQLLKNSLTQLYITGDISQSEAESYISNHFDNVENRPLPKAENHHIEPHKTIHHTEDADTAQSCLAAGIRTENVPYPKLLVANEILGGSASSRLFNKIRESNGMCYYVNSRLYRYKGIISVQAGIEAKNADSVTEAIEKELTSITKKGAPNKELQLAKESLITSLKSIEDYPSRLMDFMLSMSVADEPYSINKAIQDISAVDDISGVFDTAFIDTVFLLKEGKNE